MPWCVSAGHWSKPYGVWGSENGQPDANGMAEAPTVLNCPPGKYATVINIKPSMWVKVGEPWTGSTWVGTITMVCDDGTELTIDAQPEQDSPDFPPGNVTNPTGKVATAVIHAPVAHDWRLRVITISDEYK